MKTRLGNLYFGNYFKYDGKTYRADKPTSKYGYIACVDTETHKIKRFNIDAVVEEVKKNEIDN